MSKKTPPTQSVKAYRIPLETTVLRCPTCKVTVQWEGRPDLNLHRCGSPVTAQSEDAYHMNHHPTPHGERRDT